MHRVDQRDCVIDRCLRQNPMAEVENMTRPVSYLIQNAFGLLSNLVR